MARMIELTRLLERGTREEPLLLNPAHLVAITGFGRAQGALIRLTVGDYHVRETAAEILALLADQRRQLRAEAEADSNVEVYPR